MLTKMYQEIIVDHYRNPLNRRLIEDFDAESHRLNPTCGDEITLRISISGGFIDLGYEMEGCAISVASASAMSELIKGEALSRAADAYLAFREMFISRSHGDDDVLGDCASFFNVADYPARINCALLAWKALDHAMGQIK